MISSRRFVAGSSVILWLYGLSGSGFARIISVPGDYDLIHIAVEFASRGDTVLVEPGTYEESIRLRSIDFVVGSLLLTTGDPSYIDETIIDGSEIGTHVVRADGGDAGSPLLRGFTITGGMADYGGGVICRDSTRPVFEDLKVVGNESEYMGGGAYCYRGSAATFRRVIFEGNYSEVGGGVGEYQSRSYFENCAFLNNSAENGGGLYSQISTPTLVNCFLSQNTPGNLTFVLSHAELLRVTIDNGNLASDAVFVRGSREGEEITFDRVTFSSSREEDATLLRVIGGNGEFALPRFNLLNSIVRGHSDRLISLGDGGLEVSAFIEYSDIQGERNTIRLNGRANLLWGEHNFDADPQFIDEEAGDFGLAAESPCIDAGADWSDPDPDNSRADVGGVPFGGFSAAVTGRVIDRRNDNPVEGAEVILFDGEAEFLRSITNADGNWTGVAFLPTLFFREAEALVRAEESRNSHGRVFLLSGGVARYSAAVETNPFALSAEEFALTLDPGDSAIFDFVMNSDSELPIIWAISIEPSAGEQDEFEMREWDIDRFLAVLPDSGSLAPGASQDFQLIVRTSDEVDGTELEAGEYAAQLRLVVDDYYEDVMLPIRLTVRDLSAKEIGAPSAAAVLVTSYPQPFNSTLTVEYSLAQSGWTTVRLLETSGRVGRIVSADFESTGDHRKTIDAGKLPAGVYYLSVDAPGWSVVRKVVCLK